jgi:tetratricopeptide (TPR) repeat protein
MDCRKSCWLGMALMTGVFGCVTRSSMSNLPSTTSITPDSSAYTPVALEVTQEKDLPKRQPKPSTFVALGNFQEREAVGSERTPQDREQLLDRARRSYQQALEIDPNNVAALKALAQLYVTTKDHDRAIGTYQSALKAAPKDASIWFDLGMYQMQCKEWASAVEDMRQAVALDPENRHYTKTLGFCLARAGRFDESLICLQQAVGPAEAHYDVARMQLHLQQGEAARQHLYLALQADPQHKEARMLLAQLEAPPVPPVDTSAPTPTPNRPAVSVGFEE